MELSNKLWTATRDMHHACEHHIVGAAMAQGMPPIEWYAKWLMAINQLHAVVDPTIPAELGRVERLERDIAACGMPVAVSLAATEFANSLVTACDFAGAAYVLTGAHLMGGEIMRKRLVGYPTAHLEWEDRKAGLAWLKPMRERVDISTEARNCFSALLKIMDEICKVSKND